MHVHEEALIRIGFDEGLLLVLRAGWYEQSAGLEQQEAVS
jgi:hypothetical protein